MDLFNLLCVGRPETNAYDIFSQAILPLVVLVLMVYGTINIVLNTGKHDAKSNKRFDRGGIAFILFLVLGIILLFVLSSSSEVVRDPCDHVGPVYSVTKAFYNLTKVFIPLVFLASALLYLLRFFFIKGNKQFKKALRKRIIKYIIIAVLIFFMVTIYQALMGLVTKSGESDGSDSVSYVTCWCSD